MSQAEEALRSKGHGVEEYEMDALRSKGVRLNQEPQSVCVLCVDRMNQEVGIQSLLVLG